MTNNKNILQRALDFDLNDQEIKNFESTHSLTKDLNNSSQADVLAKELFIPGYSELIDTKKSELDKLLDDSVPVISTEKKTKNRQAFIFKLMGIAAIFLLAISLSDFFNQSSISIQDRDQKLYSLAINSFDNSGLLHSSRSSDLNNENQLFYKSYQNNVLILKDDCLSNPDLCNLTNAVIHVKSKHFNKAAIALNEVEGYTEIKNKLLLYCYLQLDDKKYLENLKIINDNKFPNYKTIKELFE